MPTNIVYKKNYTLVSSAKTIEVYGMSPQFTETNACVLYLYLSMLLVGFCFCWGGGGGGGQIFKTNRHDATINLAKTCKGKA